VFTFAKNPGNVFHSQLTIVYTTAHVSTRVSCALLNDLWRASLRACCRLDYCNAALKATADVLYKLRRLYSACPCVIGNSPMGGEEGLEEKGTEMEKGDSDERTFSSVRS